MPGTWQLRGQSQLAGIDSVVWKREGSGCASTAVVLWALCVAGSAAVSQPCGEERREAGPLQQQQQQWGQGHLQSVQARGGSGPAARAASTDNASTEPADRVLR